jgi:hypothetical protein
MADPKKDSNSEQLTQELERIRFEKDVLLQQVEELQKAISVNAHVKNAKEQLEDAKRRFDQMCRNLIREVTEVKTLHPVQVLLHAKRVEMERVAAARKRLPKGHPELAHFDEIIRDHLVELQQLEEMAAQAEQVVKYQLERIEEVAKHAANTRLNPGDADRE